jgi:hypothetical protein
MAASDGPRDQVHPRVADPEGKWVLSTTEEEEYGKPRQQVVNVELIDAGHMFSAYLDGKELAPASLNVMSQSARALHELGALPNTKLVFTCEGRLVGQHSLEHFRAKPRGDARPPEKRTPRPVRTMAPLPRKLVAPAPLHVDDRRERGSRRDRVREYAEAVS